MTTPPPGTPATPDDLDRTSRKTTATVVLVVLVALAIIGYSVILLGRAVLSAELGGVVGWGLTIGLVLIAVVGLWVVVATLRAGLDHQYISRRAAEEGIELDTSTLPRRPSGRLESDAADELFAEVRREYEDTPEDWRTLYRVGRAYDYAGDRRRGRAMLKQATARARREELSGRKGGMKAGENGMDRAEKGSKHVS